LRHFRFDEAPSEDPAGVLVNVAELPPP